MDGLSSYKKLLMAFLRLRLRKYFRRRNSDFFALFAVSREKYIRPKRRMHPALACPTFCVARSLPAIEKVVVVVEAKRVGQHGTEE
jgi:hypothetical protein